MVSKRESCLLGSLLETVNESSIVQSRQMGTSPSFNHLNPWKGMCKSPNANHILSALFNALLSIYLRFSSFRIFEILLQVYEYVSCMFTRLSNAVFQSVQRFIKNVPIASQHIKRLGYIRLILNISTYLAKPLKFAFALDVISGLFSCPHTVWPSFICFSLQTEKE